MKKTVLVIVQLLFICRLSGQDINLVVEAPNVVALGEQFTVSWTANKRGGEFIAPDLDDFTILSGPRTSFSQSTQIVNGKVTSSVSNTYTYYLQATKEGEFILDPGKFVYEKKEYLSSPAEIEVVSEGQNVQGGSSDNRESPGSDELYVRLVIDKNEVFLGEHLVASLKIYSKVNISGIQEVKYPDFNSFLKEDLETEPLRALERENVNGSIYGTGILQRFLLYPQRTGSIEIEPASLTVLLQQKNKSGDPFFGDFFSTFSNVPKVLATMPESITVKPLPPGKPETFYGAVGSFSARSAVNTDTVNVNDAITYKIFLEGKGNIQLTPAPDLGLPPDVEVYEPETSSDLRNTASGTSGTKVFEYVLIPRYHGEFTIPGMEFSYFDPGTESYKTIKTREHKLFVRKSEDEDDPATVYGGVSKENVRFLGKDIRFIDTSGPGLTLSSKLLIENRLYIYSFPAVLLVFIILIILRREHIKRNSDIARVRNRKAAGIAAKRLRSASACLNTTDTEGFYSELLKALWGYLSDKFNIPLSELNKERINSVVKDVKLDNELIDEVNEVIDKCEYARYSPDSDITAAEEIYRKAEKVIKTIEKNNISLK
ncbi:MAG: BatD family protein [Bacteroidales bacterium]|nr:BatD family protein [Bacteroidales bacterium]